MAELLAAVAEERDGIATEPPVDVDARTHEFAGDGRFGVGELAMLVERGWRGRGVGSALVAAAIEAARIKGLHKLSLDVFAHNAAAIALYHKFGFVEEGRRVAQYRRSSGELWDSIVMGLLL